MFDDCMMLESVETRNNFSISKQGSTCFFSKLLGFISFKIG